MNKNKTNRTEQNKQKTGQNQTRPEQQNRKDKTNRTMANSKKTTESTRNKKQIDKQGNRKFSKAQV